MRYGTFKNFQNHEPQLLHLSKTLKKGRTVFLISFLKTVFFIKKKKLTYSKKLSWKRILTLTSKTINLKKTLIFEEKNLYRWKKESSSKEKTNFFFWNEHLFSNEKHLWQMEKESIVEQGLQQNKTLIFEKNTPSLNINTCLMYMNWIRIILSTSCKKRITLNVYWFSYFVDRKTQYNLMHILNTKSTKLHPENSQEQQTKYKIN